MKRASVRCGLLGVPILALTVLVAACGGSAETSTTTTTAAPTTSTAPPTTSGGSTTANSEPSGTSVPLSGDEATIAANYVTFFDGTQPVEDKIGLLENGDQYVAELEAQAASPLGQAATASVSSVTITSETAATVIYSILLSGQVALPDQTGQAVLQDGVWKVSAESFLALLALQQGATTSSTEQ